MTNAERPRNVSDGWTHQRSSRAVLPNPICVRPRSTWAMAGNLPSFSARPAKHTDVHARIATRLGSGPRGAHAMPGTMTNAVSPAHPLQPPVGKETGRFIALRSRDFRLLL